jgi:hypothetical protein
LTSWPDPDVIVAGCGETCRKSVLSSKAQAGNLAAPPPPDPRTGYPMNRSAPQNDPEPGGSRRGALAGLVIVVVLLVVGLWLARELSSASRIQDCVMSGRSNCNPIDVYPR